MDAPFKIVITIVSLLAAGVICWLDPKANLAGPDSLWPLGRRNPIRMLFFRSDGTFRRYTKAGVVLWFVACLSFLWLTL